MTDSRRAIAGHLRLYRDLGVDGISRDAAWRQREDPERSAAVPCDDPPEPCEDPRGPYKSSPEPCDDPPGPYESLESLRAYIGDCTRCPLHAQGRKQIVFGSGSPNADLMFVGEAPGADEDQQGVPFVGRAGQLLTKIIESINLTRADVYIANVLKCRPPGNRNPEPIEVETCEPFLMQQIALIKPRVIVALGTFAAHLLLKTEAPISRLRGHVHELPGGAKLIPTFHPAYLLRSPERKRDVWEDMKKVRDLLAAPAATA